MKSSRTFQAKQLTSTAYLSRCPPPTGRSPGRAPPAPAWTPGWDPPAPAWPLSSFPSCLQLTAWSADIPPRPSQQRQLVTSNHPHPPLMLTPECGVETVLSMWCLHYLMCRHTGTRGLALAPCYLWQSLLIHCHIATTLPAGQGSVWPVWGCLLPAGHLSTCWTLSTLHIYSR